MTTIKDKGNKTDVFTVDQLEIINKNGYQLENQNFKDTIESLNLFTANKTKSRLDFLKSMEVKNSMKKLSNKMDSLSNGLSDRIQETNRFVDQNTSKGLVSYVPFTRSTQYNKIRDIPDDNPKKTKIIQEYIKIANINKKLKKYDIVQLAKLISNQKENINHIMANYDKETTSIKDKLILEKYRELKSQSGDLRNISEIIQGTFAGTANILIGQILTGTEMGSTVLTGATGIISAYTGISPEFAKYGIGAILVGAQVYFTIKKTEAAIKENNLQISNSRWRGLMFINSCKILVSTGVSYYTGTGTMFVRAFGQLINFSFIKIVDSTDPLKNKHIILNSFGEGTDSNNENSIRILNETIKQYNANISANILKLSFSKKYYSYISNFFHRLITYTRVPQLLVHSIDMLSKSYDNNFIVNFMSSISDILQFLYPPVGFAVDYFKSWVKPTICTLVVACCALFAFDLTTGIQIPLFHGIISKICTRVFGMFGHTNLEPNMMSPIVNLIWGTMNDSLLKMFVTNMISNNRAFNKLYTTIRQNKASVLSAFGVAMATSTITDSNITIGVAMTVAGTIMADIDKKYDISNKAQLPGIRYLIYDCLGINKKVNKLMIKHEFFPEFNTTIENCVLDSLTESLIISSIDNMATDMVINSVGKNGMFAKFNDDWSFSLGSMFENRGISKEDVDKFKGIFENMKKDEEIKIEYGIDNNYIERAIYRLSQIQEYDSNSMYAKLSIVSNFYNYSLNNLLSRNNNNFIKDQEILLSTLDKKASDLLDTMKAQGVDKIIEIGGRVKSAVSKIEGQVVIEDDTFKMKNGKINLFDEERKRSNRYHFHALSYYFDSKTTLNAINYFSKNTLNTDISSYRKLTSSMENLQQITNFRAMTTWGNYLQQTKKPMIVLESMQKIIDLETSTNMINEYKKIYGKAIKNFEKEWKNKDTIGATLFGGVEPNSVSGLKLLWTEYKANNFNLKNIAKAIIDIADNIWTYGEDQLVDILKFTVDPNLIAKHNAKGLALYARLSAIKSQAQRKIDADLKKLNDTLNMNPEEILEINVGIEKLKMTVINCDDAMVKFSQISDSSNRSEKFDSYRSIQSEYNDKEIKTHQTVSTDTKHESITDINIAIQSGDVDISIETMTDILIDSQIDTEIMTTIDIDFGGDDSSNSSSNDDSRNSSSYETDEPYLGDDIIADATANEYDNSFGKYDYIPMLFRLAKIAKRKGNFPKLSDDFKAKIREIPIEHMDLSSVEGMSDGRRQNDRYIQYSGNNEKIEKLFKEWDSTKGEWSGTEEDLDMLYELNYIFNNYDKEMLVKIDSYNKIQEESKHVTLNEEDSLYESSLSKFRDNRTLYKLGRNLLFSHFLPLSSELQTDFEVSGKKFKDLLDMYEIDTTSVAFNQMAQEVPSLWSGLKNSGNLSLSDARVLYSFSNARIGMKNTIAFNYNEIMEKTKNREAKNAVSEMNSIEAALDTFKKNKPASDNDIDIKDQMRKDENFNTVLGKVADTLGGYKNYENDDTKQLWENGKDSEIFIERKQSWLDDKDRRASNRDNQPGYVSSAIHWMYGSFGETIWHATKSIVVDKIYGTQFIVPDDPLSIFTNDSGKNVKGWSELNFNSFLSYINGAKIIKI